MFKKGVKEIISVFEVIAKQGTFLQTKTGTFISVLNQLSKDLKALEKKHQPVALLFHNCSEHDVFSLEVKLITKELNFINLSSYNLAANDGESFGLGNYDLYESSYPIEDYFSTQRSDYLNKLFFDFFLECYWNSKLHKNTLKMIYSHTTDCDVIVDLIDPDVEYHNFDFLSIE